MDDWYKKMGSKKGTMTRISIMIDGRRFPIVCRDEQEEELFRKAAAKVNSELDWYMETYPELDELCLLEMMLFINVSKVLKYEERKV